MNPQDRNLAEAELKDYGTCIVATLDIPKKQEEMAIKMIEEAIKEAVSQTQQETVKGCLEEARRMNYHGECVNCKCIVPNQMINAIKAKYPTKE